MRKETVYWSGIDPIDQFVNGKAEFDHELEYSEKMQRIKENIESRYPSLILINPTTIKIDKIELEPDK